MRISDWSSDVCSSDLGSVEWRLPWFDTKVIGSNLHAPNKVGSQDFDGSPMPIAAFYTNGQFADYKTWCYVRHHLSLNRRLQPAVRQGQFLHSSQTSAGHRRRKIGRSEEHTSELQSLMRISYAVLRLKKKQHKQ